MLCTDPQIFIPINSFKDQTLETGSSIIEKKKRNLTLKKKKNEHKIPNLLTRGGNQTRLLPSLCQRGFFRICTPNRLSSFLGGRGITVGTGQPASPSLPPTQSTKHLHLVSRILDCLLFSTCLHVCCGVGKTASAPGTCGQGGGLPGRGRGPGSWVTRAIQGAGTAGTQSVPEPSGCPWRLLSGLHGQLPSRCEGWGERLLGSLCPVRLETCPHDLAL